MRLLVAALAAALQTMRRDESAGDEGAGSGLYRVLLIGTILL